MKDGIYSRRNLDRIDKRVRVILIRGADPMTEEEQLWTLYLKKYGLCGKPEEKIYQKYQYVFRRAAVRSFGMTSFDVAIDFSGYSIWIPLLLFEIPAKKRLIWEHCDLKEDFSVVNDGALKHRNVSLKGLLSVYRKFDKIVAVNQPLMEVNRTKIGEETTKDRFGYATNLLDKRRLEKKISKTDMDSIWTDADGRRYLVYDGENTSVDGTIKMIPFEKEEDAFYFITVGRLSQEKNHENLILAFREFLKEYPKSRLFIVG